MTPEESLEPPDPDLLARWLGISSLIASAESMLVRTGGAWPRLALVTADTATEAILGLLAADGAASVADGAQFDDVYRAAIKALQDRGDDIPTNLRTWIRQTHRLRNMALHHGSEPSAAAVERAVRGAQRLRDAAVDRSPVLKAFKTSGPALAVAELVGIKAIADPLRRAAKALEHDDLKHSADAAAEALGATLQRLSPELRPRHTPFAAQHLRRQLDHGASSAVLEVQENASRRVDALESWVLALGIGMRPNELVDLQHVLGRADSMMSGDVRVTRHKDVVLTHPVVESALLKTTDLIFRLWFSDAVERNRWIDVAPGEP